MNMGGKEEEKFTRRQFVKLTAVALGLGVAGGLNLASCDLKPKAKETSDDLKEFSLNLGDEREIKLGDLLWVPDTHTSMLKIGGKYRLWLSARRETYLVETKDFYHMKEPQLVFNPDNIYDREGYRGYAGVGSVIPAEDRLLMFYHQETWGDKNHSRNFQAKVCLAQSFDQGLTWYRKGPILEGKNPAKPGERVSGAGQPCAVVKDDYVYLFYTDWNAWEPDAIHLARASLSQVGKAKSWKKCFEGEAVISPVFPEMKYTALADVGYNDYLKQWLAIFEASDGFYACCSQDLLNWGRYRKIFDFSSNGEWFSYPTLLSPGYASDRETGQEGILIYAKSEGREPHRMFGRNFSLSV
ncbi:MAG: hypothetical protein ACOX50_03965 [Patescibacteria group bacterium]|jgi:hypothetical protein